MADEQRDQQIAAVAALNEPVRGDLYRYVVAQDGEVTRDQAAQALGITRALAAFHLDRLADEGLLDTSFRRLTGKRGPGAGRPSKLYRRSNRELAVTLPRREYALAASILTQAVERAPAPEVLGGLAETARAVGESLGVEARSLVSDAADRDERMEAAVRLLTAYGFEPAWEPNGQIRLRNCPFHALAAQSPQLICGMNLDLMQGIVEGLQVHGVEAVLDPQPGMCCVAFRTIELKDSLPAGR